MPAVTFTDEPLRSRNMEGELAEYVHDSCEVITIKLIRSAEDFGDDSKAFHPAMTHQIYEEEEIFGFKEVEIDLYYLAASLKIYLSVHTSGSIKEKRSLNFTGELPDIEKPLRAILPSSNVYTNSDEFLKNLEEEAKFKPFGHQEHSFSSGEESYEVFRCSMDSSPGFKDFHERLQTFILFFIDGASYIDVDDDKWNYFVIYNKYKGEDNSWRYAVTGYATVYEYYAYPDKKRPRISQFLILPPWQRKGLGSELLRAVYRYYQGMPAVADITVEDPSDDFQMLRHYVDSSMCRDLPSFKPEKLRQGFSKEMLEEAREKFKFNPKQIRRIYEILRLGATNLHDADDLKNYRLDVKKRFFLSNKESSRSLKFSAVQGQQKDLKELLEAAYNKDVMRQQLKELFDSQFPIWLQIWNKVDSASSPA